MRDKNFIFLKRKRNFFLTVFQKQGFSLVELLTTVSIIGVLSTVGIRSYKSQTNKARSAEAKHSLSYLYTAEKSFKDLWDSYYENLIIVGAIPSGSYYYDVGFHSSADLTASFEGTHPLDQAALGLAACIDFRQICQGACLTAISTATANSVYFTGTNVEANCKVTGGAYVKDYAGTDSADYDASEIAYKAMARSKLGGDEDVWSIDHSRIIEHVEDGTD